MLGSVPWPALTWFARSKGRVPDADFFYRILEHMVVDDFSTTIYLCIENCILYVLLFFRQNTLALYLYQEISGDIRLYVDYLFYVYIVCRLFVVFYIV